MKLFLRLILVLLQVLLQVLGWVVIMTNSGMATANEGYTTFTVEVTNIEVSRGGNVSVMVFAKKGFPKIHKNAVLVKTQEVTTRTMIFSFSTELKTLAIKVHHDQDSNGKVTKNWTGIWPKEGLGFSNQQKVSLAGAPKYEKSKRSYEQFRDGLSISILYP